MKHLIPILFLALSSCGDSKIDIGTSEAKKEDAKTDSLEVVEKPQIFPEELASLHQKLKVIDLPFADNSAFLEKIELKKELSYKEFEFLSSNFKNVLDFDDWPLSECREFYMLKANNSYDEYVNSLDIGMLRKCDAYPYGISITPNAFLVYWLIDYSSYEACPYFSGREMFVSKIVDGKVEASMKVCAEAVSGDPPASGSTKSTFEIKPGFSLKKEEVNEEYDDEELIDVRKKDTLVTF